MEPQLIKYLEEHWNKDLASKLQFSIVPKDKGGDLAVNFFALTKALGKNPLEIGSEVQKALEVCPLVEKSQMVGPYLNLYLVADQFFQDVLETPIEGKILKGKTIMVEYSGPNTNKPLHLGHMRNHALGISLCALFEAAGAKVHRVNILNDKGLALAKSMLAYDHFGEGKTPESEGIKPDLFAGNWYVRYDLESKKNPELEKELPEIMRKWEAGDPYWQGLWKKMTDWVLAGVRQTYQRQGVWFDKEYRESAHYERGREFAYEGLKKGVFQQKEDGSIYIDLKDLDMGEKTVLRSDGTAIYLTQDLSLWPIRKKDFGHIDEMIHVVGDEQDYYFKTVFESLRKLDLAGDTKFTFYGYGLVNLPTGRMKSREGTVVDADNLMDELAAAAAEKLAEQGKFNAEETHATSEQVMNAAWKFFLLKTSPTKSITFDAQKSVDFQGDSGPYLQYAGVRIKSIFEKAGFDLKTGLESRPVLADLEFTEAEKPLGVKILQWPHVLERAAENENPTFIVTYLLELAQAWSSFYGQSSILNAENEALKKARLALAAKTYHVLEKGLAILGIEIPEKM